MKIQLTSRTVRAVLAFAICLFPATAAAMTAPAPAAAPPSAAPATSPVAEPPAATGRTSLSGSVVDRGTGLPVSGAVVRLNRANEVVETTTTDGRGRFAFSGQLPGFYAVEVSRDGYQAARSDDVLLLAGVQSATVSVALVASASGNNLREIGHVSSGSTLGSGLQSTSTVSYTLTTQNLARSNYSNVGDALDTLPGTNFSGHSSSVGDDLSISLRGFDPSESQTLIDGHPIGPIGVGGGGFDYQISPYYVLRDTQVTFGAGALGLYGTDATGGAIDLQTIDPTHKPQSSVTQGFGSQGKSFSAIQATGTIGRFGYAIAGGVQGTYGNFAPQDITQTNLLSNASPLGHHIRPAANLSPSSVAANTYLVSGAYVLRDALLKLRYEVKPGTAFTVTGYSATSYDDKSGVGDNDFVPYSVQLQNALGLVGKQGKGARLTCPHGITVQVTDAGGTACETPQQFAAQTSGPSGGGPGPFQTIDNQDYHGRFVTTYHGSTVAVDGFLDSYVVNYNRNVSGGYNAAGVLTGGFNSNVYETNGFLISDDIYSGPNEFGFGYYTQHQTATGNTFDTASLALVPNEPVALGNGNVFFRDVYEPTPWFQFFSNIWYKTLSTTGQDTVDPRATIVLRPSAHDVVRFVGGKTDGEPAASLALTNFNTTPGNINPDCSTLGGGKHHGTNTDPVNVGTIGATGLNQESATDFEVAYGHAFDGGSSVQIAGYDTREANIITSINVPVLPGQIPAYLLTGYYDRVRSVCGRSAALSDLALSQAVNSTQSGLFRGLELSGHIAATHHVSFDLTYDLQQAQIFGYTGGPNGDLANNPNDINGGQIAGVPMNKASASVDYLNGGLEARVDSYLVGPNNAFSRPAYFFANGSLSYEFRKTGTALTLGVFNIFDNASDNYGRFGLGLSPPINSYAAASPPQAPERFGQLPTTFSIAVTQRTL